MNTPRHIAESVFEMWSKSGTLETDWMNPEDKEPFINAIVLVIKNERAQSVNTELLTACKEALVAVDESYLATGYIKICNTSEQRLRIEAAVARAEGE